MTSREQLAKKLAWKCQHGLTPCEVSGLACPFVEVEGEKGYLGKPKCKDVTSDMWLKALEEA